MDLKDNYMLAWSRRQIERMHYFLLGQAGDIYELNKYSISKPTPTVVGPSTICENGATFYVSNHQLGTVVSWSVSPSNAVQVATDDGSQADLVPSSTYTGSATITFVVDYGYYGTKSASKTFTISEGITGTVTSGGYTNPMYSGNHVTSTSVSAAVEAPGATSFTWTKVGGSGSWYTYNSGKNLSLTLAPNGDITFTISTTNSTCGTLSRTVYFSEIGGYYIFYPNPTVNELYVKVKEQSTEIDVLDKTGASKKVELSFGIDQISLYSKNGNFIKQKKLPKGSLQGSIDLNGLMQDMYVVKVMDGERVIEAKIMKN